WSGYGSLLRSLSRSSPLGACTPPLHSRALEREPRVVVVLHALPCRGWGRGWPDDCRLPAARAHEMAGPGLSSSLQARQKRDGALHRNPHPKAPLVAPVVAEDPLAGSVRQPSVCEADECELTKRVPVWAGSGKGRLEGREPCLRGPFRSQPPRSFPLRGNFISCQPRRSQPRRSIGLWRGPS